MAAPVSQKEYLKRYLGGNDEKKKKKKKKDKSAGSKVKGMRIIEDSFDLKNVPFGYVEEDDNPTIAEITYEDEKMKVMEEYQGNKKWKKVEDDKQVELRGIGSMIDNDYKTQDLDASPPRTQKGKSDVQAPKRKRHDSDGSPPRRQRHDSDGSPPRRQRHDSDASPPRGQRHDSDTSPPRRQRHDSDASPPRGQRHDSDTSPRRRQRHDSDDSPPRRQRHDSDASPPRRQRHDSDASPPRRQRSDSDASPPRRQRHDSDASPPRRGREDSDSSASRRVGHSGSPSVREGNQRPERKMTTQEYLLARKRGKLKKDTPEDLMRKEREKLLQSKAEDKHQEWKYGVKQVQQYQQKLADDKHEMGKAFARSADDVDMNVKLKEVIRDDDPMLQYLQKKQVKTNKGPVKPLYQGPFPPNRLNIRPGYRWDGVDRSSGFEKQWFERQNNKRAHDEDAYKWSVSDM